MAKEIGTEWVPGEDREVPAFEPSVGESVEKAAKKLGYRVLARREQVPEGAIVAIICDGGLKFRCVKGA